MAKEGYTYADSGVHVDLGDKASDFLYKASLETYKNRDGKIGEIKKYGDRFFSVRAISIRGLKPDAVISGNTDGVGTKVEFGERTGNHRSMAFNLMAMLTEDAARFGAEPIYTTNILDVNELNDENVETLRQLALGLIDACAAAEVANLTGELAELGKRVGGYGPFNYNWGGSVTWVADPNKLITGKDIRKDMPIVALMEPGFRSNGISSVRKILEFLHGQEWHQALYKEGIKWGDAVLEPSVLYTKALLDMFGRYGEQEKTKIYGIAHITGGGVPGKLGRLLEPTGLGAHLDALFEPCEMMLKLQEVDMPEKGPMQDKSAYQTWNMRNGMLIVAENPEEVIQIAKDNNIEAKLAGKTTDSGNIEIKSKGLHSNGKILDDWD